MLKSNNEFLIFPYSLYNLFKKLFTSFPLFNYQGSQYWRFTNDIKDAGYPKLISKGFGGLNGKIVAALSIAQYKNRPESVYFFKRGMCYLINKIKKLLRRDLTGKFHSIFSFITGITVSKYL